MPQQKKHFVSCLVTSTACCMLLVQQVTLVAADDCRDLVCNGGRAYPPRRRYGAGTDPLPRLLPYQVAPLVATLWPRPPQDCR